MKPEGSKGIGKLCRPVIYSDEYGQSTKFSRNCRFVQGRSDGKIILWDDHVKSSQKNRIKEVVETACSRRLSEP